MEVDATPPVVSVVASANGNAIEVTWSASDAGAGLDACALAYREGQGTWQHSGTDTFEGLQPRVAYTFHLTATDNVSNQAQAEDTASVREVTKYYHFGGQRVAMRQPDGEVAWLHGDHLGSTSLATDESGAAISRQLYTPFGQARWVTGTLPTDFGFTGQRLDGTGLMFYHARYYDPALGRFVQADTIVPEPGNPQDFNRYSYCRNSPVNFNDPTGFFTQDEIMRSLTDQYGEEEAKRIWNLWMLDSAWMWALYLAKDGWDIWASEKGYGTFDVSESGRIRINWQVKEGDDIEVDLFAFQGQGGYLLWGLEDEKPRVGPCGYSSLCMQPVYGYDAHGRIIGDYPKKARMVWWEDNLFGVPQPTTWIMDTEIKEAPWRPSSSCETDFLCKAIDEWGLGAIAPGPLGVLHDASNWAYDQFYDLMVVWKWDPYMDLTSFSNTISPPAAFQYEYLHRRPDRRR